MSTKKISAKSAPAKKAASKPKSAVAKKGAAKKGAAKKGTAKSKKAGSHSKEPVAVQDPPCDCASNAAMGLPARLSRKVRSAVNEGATAASSNDWRVAKCLLRLRTQVNAKAPRRKKDSDGTIGDTSHQNRNSDHNPWVDDGVVTAMDITHDTAHGCDANKIAEAIRAAKDKRVKYIIWNKRIANSSKIGTVAAWAWRRYTGRNPHTAHVHISVKSDKALYDDVSDWSTGL